MLIISSDPALGEILVTYRMTVTITGNTRIKLYRDDVNIYVKEGLTDVYSSFEVKTNPSIYSVDQEFSVTSNTTGIVFYFGSLLEGPDTTFEEIQSSLELKEKTIIH